MDVPAYRIYNVLKIFSRRLYEEENRKRHPLSHQRPDIHRVSIAVDGKLRSIADRVTAEIFNRLSESSLSSPREGENRYGAPARIKITLLVPEDFTYRMIDSQNREKTVSMSVEDPSDLIERLE